MDFTLIYADWKKEWKAAQASMRRARTWTAPKPGWVGWRFCFRHPRFFFRYLKAWCWWVPRTWQHWRRIWKERNQWGDYRKLAKKGVSARQIFKRTGRSMHLTEEEIHREARSIRRGEFGF